MDRLAYLRGALTPKYLSGKPSFKRCEARAAKLKIELTRTEYNQLKSEVRTLGGLFETMDARTIPTPAEIPDGFEIKKIDLNAWSPGHLQVKTSLERTKPGAVGLDAVELRPVSFEVQRTGDRRLRALFVPDTHIGYYRDGDTLQPMHDERALAVVQAVAEHHRPDVIVIMGDWLDLAGFSSFDTSPELRHMVQPALQTAHDRLARLRPFCGAMVYLEGNHEARIHKALVRGLPEAHGIRRVGDEAAVMSLRHLLRLDELGIEYVGPYGTVYWLDGIRLIHGHVVGAHGGQTATKLLAQYTEPVVCGHTHRLELARKARRTADGRRVVWAMSAGVLARVDGTVPGSHTDVDWHQGFGALWAGGQPAIYAIEDGATTVDGYQFTAEEAT